MDEKEALHTLDKFFLDFYTLLYRHAYKRELDIKHPKELPAFAVDCYQHARRTAEDDIRHKRSDEIRLTDRGCDIKINVIVEFTENNINLRFEAWDNRLISKLDKIIKKKIEPALKKERISLNERH